MIINLLYTAEEESNMTLEERRKTVKLEFKRNLSLESDEGTEEISIYHEGDETQAQAETIVDKRKTVKLDFKPTAGYRNNDEEQAVIRERSGTVQLELHTNINNNNYYSDSTESVEREHGGTVQLEFPIRISGESEEQNVEGENKREGELYQSGDTPREPEQQQQLEATDGEYIEQGRESHEGSRNESLVIEEQPEYPHEPVPEHKYEEEPSTYPNTTNFSYNYSDNNNNNTDNIHSVNNNNYEEHRGIYKKSI